MLLGNINGKKLVKYYILSSIINIVFSIIAYIILGSFYVANNNTILVNILVWTITILLSFSLFYFPYFLINKFFTKDKLFGPLLNGYAIAFGFIGILSVCLARSYSLNDYTYVEVMGFMAGIVGFIQIIFDSSKKIKNKKDSIN